MGSVSIGIKLADNKFFPIMDDGIEGSKMLELTTVSESQESVQIHLYRSKGGPSARTIHGAEYIGTLIIEDIARKPAGAPTIKLKITLDGNGVLSAEARDIDSGTRQSLKVSLRDLSKEALAPAPDFDITSIGSEGTGPAVLDGKAAAGGAAGFGAASAVGMATAVSAFSASSPKPASSPSARGPESPYASRAAGQYKGKKGVFVPAWLCVLILVAGIALLAAALVFAWRLFFSNAAASPEASPSAVALYAEEATPPPVWEDDAVAVAVEPPEPPEPPKPAPAAPDVRYQVKWGDTLWDLAETFYRDPWRFSDIARHNGIENPSLIVVGTYLAIPAE